MIALALTSHHDKCQMGEIKINHQNVVGCLAVARGGTFRLLFSTNRGRDESRTILRPWIEDPLTTAIAQLSTVTSYGSFWPSLDSNANLLFSRPTFHSTVLQKGSRIKGKRKKIEQKDLCGPRDYYLPCSTGLKFCSITSHIR